MSASPSRSNLQMAELLGQHAFHDPKFRLSPAEVEFIPEANARDSDERAARSSALAIHAKAVQRAAFGRERLVTAIEQKAPLLAAIDAHARAQCWLREAAQAVCDICEFDDNGRAAGVVWETPLAITEGGDRG